MGKTEGQLGHRQAWGGRREARKDRAFTRGHRPLDTPSSGPTPAQRAPGLAAAAFSRGQQDPKAVKGRGRRHGRPGQSLPSGTPEGEALASQSWAAFSPPLPLCPLWRIPALSASDLGGTFTVYFLPRPHLPEHTQSHICDLERPGFAFCFSHVTHHLKDFLSCVCIVFAKLFWISFLLLQKSFLSLHDSPWRETDPMADPVPKACCLKGFQFLPEAKGPSYLGLCLGFFSEAWSTTP